MQITRMIVIQKITLLKKTWDLLTFFLENTGKIKISRYSIFFAVVYIAYKQNVIVSVIDIRKLNLDQY